MEPIENEYFNWLCAKVLEPYSRNYVTLLYIIHKTEFVYIIPADAHRFEDGLELRIDFVRETNIEPDASWENLPCSVLEFLIAFAKRANFQTDIPIKDWFWRFMTNLGLEDFRHVSDSDIPLIEKILYTFTHRQYDWRGDGGLFPLRHTHNDQREVEIWYQFFEYLDDQGLF